MFVQVHNSSFTAERDLGNVFVIAHLLSVRLAM